MAWCVTHLNADYQDLYIERFKDDDPKYYLYQGEWRRADLHHQRIMVKDSADVDMDVWVTHHGPLISGSPQQGSGLAFKYTATEGPSAWPDILWQMLRAKNANELVESMREWVDPGNSFLFADVHGNTGNLCRGRIPIRSKANAWLPVPGWTGDHEWKGNIPFDELPRSLNPKVGYIATANNRPVDDDYPFHIAVDYVPEFRVRRVTEGLLSLDRHAIHDMPNIHSQR